MGARLCEARKNVARMAQDEPWGPDKEPHGAKVLLLKSACFDSTFKSTCHVCLPFPWMSRCGLFSRGQFEPVKAGRFGIF